MIGFGKKVIDFCSKTGTEIQIDLYVNPYSSEMNITKSKISSIEGLSEKTFKLIGKVFSNNDKAEVIKIIQNECGNHLPLCNDLKSCEIGKD